MTEVLGRHYELSAGVFWQVHVGASTSPRSGGVGQSRHAPWRSRGRSLRRGRPLHRSRQGESSGQAAPCSGSNAIAGHGSMRRGIRLTCPPWKL